MKKILFITKNFPPQIGGIENYSFNLYNHLNKYTKVYLIANKKSKFFLPIFGFIAFFKGIYLIRRIDIIYIGDGSISFLGYILGKLFNKDIYITIHGLDITWKNKIYQKIIPNIIKKYDKIIAVSSNTKKICIEKGIDEDKIEIIYNGLDLKKLPKVENHINKEKILTKYGIKNINGKRILFTIGRFTERKGIHYFLENVFSKLNKEKYIYIIGGFGKYKEKYKKIIEKYELNNVFLIGELDINKISRLETISDLFIMPNIKVDGDVEGFGITVIEAGYYGLPVIGSNIEGLKDSILNNETGILINDLKDRDENWIKEIECFNYNKFKKEKIKTKIINNFCWEVIIKKYLNLIK